MAEYEKERKKERKKKERNFVFKIQKQLDKERVEKKLKTSNWSCGSERAPDCFPNFPGVCILTYTHPRKHTPTHTYTHPHTHMNEGH